MVRPDAVRPVRWWAHPRDAVERVCHVVAGALVLSGLLHLGLLLVDDRAWEGPVSWRKPATFGLSFGLTLVTLTVLARFLPLRRRPALLGVLATACTVEVVVITVQAWRGLPSHFVPEDAPLAALSAGLGAVAALGAGAIVVVGVAMTAAALRPAPATRMPPSMRLAVRVGLFAFTVSSGVGVAMLAGGMVLARSGPGVDAAFAYTAGLKLAHAATLHGVQVLPLLAGVAGRSARDERWRVRLVAVAVAGYVSVVGGAFGAAPEALGPSAATGLAGAGIAVLVGTAAVALGGCRHARTRIVARGEPQRR